jgi:hypothetical protein
MDLADKPFRSPEVHVERVDEDILAYHPRGDRILQFNQTAAIIWQLCDGSRTVQEISRLLSEAYPDQAAQVNVELPGILRTLEEFGCIGPA